MKITRAVVSMLLGWGIALTASGADPAPRGPLLLRVDAAALVADMVPTAAQARTAEQPGPVITGARSAAFPNGTGSHAAFDPRDFSNLLGRVRLAPAAGTPPVPAGGPVHWLATLAIAGLVARRRLL